MKNTNIFTQASGDSLLAPRAYLREVFDTTSCRIIKAQDVVGDNAPQVFALREKVTEFSKTAPLYLCPECRQPLILAMQKDRSGFYFRHQYANRDCPIKDERNKSRKDINKSKYKDSNESALHRSLKSKLELCLQYDNAFTNVKKERWWKGEDGESYRRPDIQADYNENLHIAFEIQLSTTYIDDISDRMNFAKQNKGILIWIAHEFDEQNIRTSFMDSFYANNSNIFIFNDEMYEKSMDTKKLHLKCLWITPVESNIQQYSIKTQVISFDEIHFNQEKQWAYFFDFAHASEVIREKKEREKLEQLRIANTLCSSNWNTEASEEEVINFLGTYYNSQTMRPYKARILINSILSIIKGHPQGWNFQNNKEIFHFLYLRYPELLIFICVLEKNISDNFSNDRKIYDKKKNISEDIKINTIGSRFAPITVYDSIIEEMFPNEYKKWQEFRIMHCI